MAQIVSTGVDMSAPVDSLGAMAQKSPGLGLGADARRRLGRHTATVPLRLRMRGPGPPNPQTLALRMSRGCRTGAAIDAVGVRVGTTGSRGHTARIGRQVWWANDPPDYLPRKVPDDRQSTGVARVTRESGVTFA